MLLELCCCRANQKKLNSSEHRKAWRTQTKDQREERLRKRTAGDSLRDRVIACLLHNVTQNFTAAWAYFTHAFITRLWTQQSLESSAQTEEPINRATRIELNEPRCMWGAHFIMIIIYQGGNFRLKVGGAHDVGYIYNVSTCGLEYFTLD